MGEETELDVLVGEGGVAGLVVESDEDSVIGGVVVLEPEMVVLKGGRSGCKLPCLVDYHVAEDLDFDCILD